MAAAIAVAACSKSEEAKKAPPAPASATPSASALAPDAGPGAETPTFSGTYSLAPAKMYIPESKDWVRVKQATDDPAKLVGDGALSLSVDATGRVSGEIEGGPAAPAVIDGTAIDSEIRAVVRRKDPADGGLTGTFAGTRTAESVTGTLSLAEGNAAIVRAGTFTLKKK
jgi:hypothetical protein